MQRLLVLLLVCLLLTGCSSQPAPVPEEPAAAPELAPEPVTEPEETVPEPEETVPVYDSSKPVTGVYVDTSGLTSFQPPQELYTRRSETFTEDLISGDYGLLRPYYGSRAAFDMTIYGGSGIYNGYMGLIDEHGAIVVDPVYTDIGYLYDQSCGDPAPFYLLSKGRWVENDWGGYMGQVHGFCSLDGKIAIPCQYEQISCWGDRIVAVQDAKAGMFHVYDTDGNLLLDSANWQNRPTIYLSDGMGTATVSEHLLFFSVQSENGEPWDVEFHLYDWQGNLISDQYDWVELYGEPPYACGSWDGEGSGCGYIDGTGQPMPEQVFDSVSAFYDGQALVTIGGMPQVIDSTGNTLWTAPEGELHYVQSDGCRYYLWRKNWDSVYYLRYYDMDFEQMYPEAEYIQYVCGDFFLIWQDDRCTLTNGKLSAEVPDAENPGRRDYYFSGTDGGLSLINSWYNGQYTYWLYDDQLQLLRHETLVEESVDLLYDRIGGSGVAVRYLTYTYPYGYTALDYPGGPKLENVRVLGVYGGWYLVEDAFSSGYMDAEGNWLFRVNLMTDMTD